MASIPSYLRLLSIGPVILLSAQSHAQTPAMPAPTPVPASSVPSYPASDAPQPAPVPADPLEAPIVLKNPGAAPTGQPAQVNMPSPQTVASLPSRPAYAYTPLVLDHPD